MTELTVPVVSWLSRKKKSKIKLFSGKVKGTVFSGHPTRTTFGNTLRVITFVKFILYLADITNYHLSVGGDDI